VDAANPTVSIKHRGKAKRLTEQERRLLKRRQAIEPIVEHLKSDHRMDRCPLKGQTGDAIHAVLCAAGYNIKWMLRIIRKKGIHRFLSLIEALELGQRTKANGQSNRINPFSGFKTCTQRALA
jgi:IS5 family transposase